MGVSGSLRNPRKINNGIKEYLQRKHQQGKTGKKRNKYTNVSGSKTRSSCFNKTFYTNRENGRRLTHLRLPDDLAIFVETNDKLDEMISTLREESEKVGLIMNQDITKLMTNSKTACIKLFGKQLECKQLHIPRQTSIFQQQ